MQYLYVKKHIKDCAMAYTTMFLLLVLGMSSGMWFFFLSETDPLSLPMVKMLQCVSIDFWECFFAQFWFLFLLFILVMLSCGGRALVVLGYLCVFAVGVSFGAGIMEGFAVGGIQGTSVVFFGLTVALLFVYLNVVNYCFRNGKWGSLPGYKGKNKQLRIYLSCAALLLVLNIIWAYLTVLINRSV